MTRPTRKQGGNEPGTRNQRASKRPLLATFALLTRLDRPAMLAHAFKGDIDPERDHENFTIDTMRKMFARATEAAE